MDNIAEYNKLLNKLDLDYLDFFEHRRFRKLEAELGVDKTVTKIVTFLNPFLRKEPVFNPIVEAIRQFIVEK